MHVRCAIEMELMRRISVHSVVSIRTAEPFRGDSSISCALRVAEGKVTPSKPFEVPRPYFRKAGITHKEEAVGGPDDPERLAIMVDLKAPAAGARTLTLSDTEPAFPREGAKDVREFQLQSQKRIRAVDHRREAGRDAATKITNCNQVAGPGQTAKLALHVMICHPERYASPARTEGPHSRSPDHTGSFV